MAKKIKTDEGRGEVVKTTVRIDKTLWKLLQHRAVEEECSTESLVEAALAAFLKVKA